MMAPSHCRVNEVLCHHLKPAAPLAGKTQNQLPSIVSPLNFPRKLESLSLSNVLLPLAFDLLWSGATSRLLKAHLLRAVTQLSRPRGGQRGHPESAQQRGQLRASPKTRARVGQPGGTELWIVHAWN